MGRALEALRVYSTIFVVLYHASLAYVATPLRLTMWVAFEPTGFAAFDVFVYWVNGFAMPVFFLAAGVSAPAACESRGVRVFLASRAERLLRPLLFGCLTILPAFYLLWGYGLMVTGRCDLDDILSWKFGPQVRHNLYGLGHLWFLEYLFSVCVVWSVGWAILRRLGGPRPDPVHGQRWSERLLASRWSPLFLAVPTIGIFLVNSDTMLRVDNVILPDACRLLHYLVFFVVGGWLSKIREPRERLAGPGPAYLCLSFVVFALMLPLLMEHASAPLQGWRRIALCGLAGAFPWLVVLGGLGTFLRSDRPKSAAMRFLSEGSFWVYLIHVPIVAFVQLLLLPRGWPVPVKFLVVSGSTLAVSFGSYIPLVRHSAIGLIVNGARRRMPKGSRFGPEFGWAATLGVSILLFAAVAWPSRVFLLRNNLHEEVPGELYRSARLKPAELDEVIRREGLRSVITFTGGGDARPWFVKHREVCEERGVELRGVALRRDHIPSRAELVKLIEALDRSPRPVLIQGYRGTEQVGFASAVALLLDGAPPAVALRQFDLKYGQFRDAQHSALARSLLDYRDWLSARQSPHSAALLREWARGNTPFEATPEGRDPRGRIARDVEGSKVTR